MSIALVASNREAVLTFSPGLRSYPGKGWLLYVPTATRLRQSGVVPEFEDEVSTESGSDRVTVLAISILAIGRDPVATALGTDFINCSSLSITTRASYNSSPPKLFLSSKELK